MAVDNILDMRYFRDLLPQLRDRQLGLTLFYETKANLTKEQVKLLRDAGVRGDPARRREPEHPRAAADAQGRDRAAEHPAAQVVQAVRRDRRLESAVRLSRRDTADYADISRSMASLWHLPPPHAVGAIRMDRFSPYYNEAASFGLVNVRPMDMYRLLYPLPEERLRNLAYFFDFDHADGAAPGVPGRRATRRGAVAAGRQLQPDGHPRDGSPELVITDTRPNAVHDRIAMNGIQREIYELCDQRRHVQGLLRAPGERYAIDAGFRGLAPDFLPQMVEWRLMAREGEEYLEPRHPGRSRVRLSLR